MEKYTTYCFMRDVISDLYISFNGNFNNRKIFNMRRTKSQKLNGSRLVLQLLLSNPLKPGVKSSMKM